MSLLFASVPLLTAPHGRRQKGAGVRPPIQSGPIRPVVAAVCLSAALISTGCKSDSDRATAERDRVIQFVERDGTYPVAVSPDGTKILTKAAQGDPAQRTPFVLAVVDRETGRTVAQLPGQSQLLLSWRPDSRGIAFVMDPEGGRNRKLYYWQIDRPQADVVDPVLFRAATRLMTWSADGCRLAYSVEIETPVAGLEKPLRDDLVKVLDFCAVKPTPRALARTTKDITAYQWSPDGTRMAVLENAEPRPMLTLVSADGQVGTGVPLPAGMGAKHLAWSPDGRKLLLTGRHGKARQFDALHEVDLTSGAVRTLIADPGNVEYPRYLDSRRVLYHFDHGGERRLFLLNLPAAGGTEATRGASRQLSPSGGDTQLGFVAADGTLYVENVGVDRPRALYRTSSDGGAAERVFPKQIDPELIGVAPRQIWLPVASGTTTMQVLHWSGNRGGKPRGVYLGAHSGYRYRLAYDSQVQAVVKSGWDVLHVQHRGSSAFDATFQPEQRREEQVRDILVAYDHAIRVLGVPAQRIIMGGHSFGASLAAQAALAAPQAIGGVVLAAMVGAQAPERPGAPFTGTVTALHGALDEIPVAAAERAITQLFGADALTAPRGRMIVLPGEPHTFRQPRSRGITAWAIIQALQQASAAD